MDSVVVILMIVISGVKHKAERLASNLASLLKYMAARCPWAQLLYAWYDFTEPIASCILCYPMSFDALQRCSSRITTVTKPDLTMHR